MGCELMCDYSDREEYLFDINLSFELMRCDFYHPVLIYNVTLKVE